MRLKLFSILAFSSGIVLGTWFGINRVEIEVEAIPTKSFMDLLALTFGFGGFVFAGLSFAIAYHVYSEWKAQHKQELLTSLKTESIAKMLKCNTALSHFIDYNACKETSIAFGNAISELQSLNMRYFSMLSSKELSTIELIVFNVTNDHMQLAKDYVTLMANIYNSVNGGAAVIQNGRIIYCGRPIVVKARLNMLKQSIIKLGLKVEIKGSEVDIKKIHTETYTFIVNNSGQLVSEAYSSEERI